MGEKMKIAVIGLYFDSNLGDAVICDCVAYWLREEYSTSSIDIIDLGGRSDFPVQREVSVYRKKVRKIKAKIEHWLIQRNLKDVVYYWSKKSTDSCHEFYTEVAARNYDIAIFAGGQLFMDWLSLPVAELLKLFETSNTPVIFNACGAGPVTSKRIQDILRSNLSNNTVKSVSSRDDIKKINELYFDGREKVIQTFDPALWASNVYSKAKKDSNVIGLGVMYCEHIKIEELVAFWKKIIRELGKKKIHWKMFCNGSLRDYNLGCRILDEMNLNKEEYIYDYACKPEILVEQIASFDALISFRLHSHIIAASLSVPSVAIVWDDKLRFFFRHLKHEERCMRIDDSAEKIMDALITAQKEGYDFELIEKQKKFARKLLLDKAKKEISYGER